MEATPDPTPEEIAAACKEIRKGWTASQRAARREGSWEPTPWELPVVPEPEGFDSEMCFNDPGY